MKRDTFHVVPDLGPRYLLGRRVHHGLVGALMVLVGIVLAVDDWADRWWAPRRRA